MKTPGRVVRQEPHSLLRTTAPSQQGRHADRPAAVAEKQAAMKQFDDHYRAAIHFAVGLCRLAGSPDLARQLRTSRIYRG